MIDLSREKNYLLIAAILSLLSSAKWIGGIISIVVIVLEYLAFSGFEEKLGLSRPKAYYIRSIIVGIVAGVIAIGAIALTIASGFGSDATYEIEGVGTGTDIIGYVTHTTSFYVSTTTGTSTADVSDKNAIIIIGAFAIAWVPLVISVWYSTKAYTELGNFFGIDEFEKYRMCTLALIIGLPLWILLTFAVIGLVIIIGLAIAGIVFKILGITKIPEKYEKGDNVASATPFEPVTY